MVSKYSLTARTADPMTFRGAGSLTHMYSDAPFGLRPPGAPNPTVHIRANKGEAWAKVGLPGERFWCKIESVDGDGMVQMTIDNTLRESTKLRAGDRIALPRKHVLDVATTADLQDWMARVHAARALADSDEAARRNTALAFWADRIASGVAPLPHQNTRLVVDEAGE